MKQNVLNLTTMGSSEASHTKKQLVPFIENLFDRRFLLIVTIEVIIVLSVFFLVAFIQISQLKSEIHSTQQQLRLVQDFQRITSLQNIIDEFDSLGKILHLQMRQNFSLLENKTQQLTNALYNPGRDKNYPAASCDSIIGLAPSSPSGYYWVRSSNGSAVSTYCIINNLYSRGQVKDYPAISCADIHLNAPSFPSAHYWVRSSNGSTILVYCDMTRSCGNITGGWMRVAELDMTNNNFQCPYGLQKYIYPDGPHRRIYTCRKNDTYGDCFPLIFSAASVPYSKVCGKIQAYQYGITNAFNTGYTNIETHYVDGISLTHGRPRQHIWTFVAAQDSVGTNPFSDCPCNLGIPLSPDFVGNDYFCDTGSLARNQRNKFYSDNPLWDGEGCSVGSTCCSFNNPPWFYKQLPQSTNDDIEMRVCSGPKSQDIVDIPLEFIEIYVQ